MLLEKALLGKTVCAFGEDGFGQYGRHDQAYWFTIKSVEILVYDGLYKIDASVVMRLEGYDSNVLGHIMTDKNFEISLRSHLKAARLDPESLKWQKNADYQGVWTVAMDIDLDTLM